MSEVSNALYPLGHHCNDSVHDDSVHDDSVSVPIIARTAQNMLYFS